MPVQFCSCSTPRRRSHRSGQEARETRGAVALSLLSAPLNVHLLQALEEGPMALIDLRRSVGSPPQSTMRVYSRTLVDLGTLERQRQAAFPGTVEYASTDSGKALLGIGAIHEKWLHEAPSGPVSLGSTASKSATKALVEGWSTNIIRALAAKPLSLTDLNRLIPRISYPSLERRLGALRLADLVEPHPGDGRGTPYRATPGCDAPSFPSLPGLVGAALPRRSPVDRSSRRRGGLPAGDPPDRATLRIERQMPPGGGDPGRFVARLRRGADHHRGRQSRLLLLAPRRRGRGLGLGQRRQLDAEDVRSGRRP